jgi:hypothetical protein
MRLGLAFTASNFGIFARRRALSALASRLLYLRQPRTPTKVMKKLALLQLLLLPLAGLAEAPKVVEPAAMRCEEPSAADRAWQRSEAGFKELAKRLLGFSYAQGDLHRPPR